jgi:hypothetical protein
MKHLYYMFLWDYSIWRGRGIEEKLLSLGRWGIPKMPNRPSSHMRTWREQCFHVFTFTNVSKCINTHRTTWCLPWSSSCSSIRPLSGGRTADSDHIRVVAVLQQETPYQLPQLATSTQTHHIALDWFVTSVHLVPHEPDQIQPFLWYVWI